jgi:hypothetical protein
VTELIAVAATGSVGSGFLEESFSTALDAGADFVGCDAGSSDGGPYFLGAGKPKVSAAAYSRDLRVMLRGAIERGIPLVIGNAGYAGGRPHLKWSTQLLMDVARQEGLHFSLATIDTQLTQAAVRAAWRQGRVRPLGTDGELSDEKISALKRVVAQIGSEPIEAALRRGAQVVMSGRTTDTAIFAAYPRTVGLDGGATWHAAKVLECGAACVERRSHPDSIFARIDEKSFVVTPPNPAMRCTAQSVAAHTLYENADPFKLIEPAVIVDTSRCQYTQLPDDRSVRVTGTELLPKDRYDVRLEAARAVGYRSVAIGAVRDPLVLATFSEFFSGARESALSKVTQSMGLSRDSASWEVSFRVFGRDAALGALEPISQVDGHELGILIDVVARSQEQARGICAVVWHTFLHHPVSGMSGLTSNLAFPFSPPHADLGIVYEFALNHVLEIDDPAGPFKVVMCDV